MISNFTHSSDFLFFNAEKKRRTLLGFIIAFIVLNSSFLTAQTQTVIFNTAGDGSWTVPPYVTSITVEAWGGGGGGGGSNTDGSRGSGGGSGGYTTRTYAVTPNTDIAYTIGAAGAPGSSGNNNPGGTGGTTAILNLYAYGGTGGVRNNGTVGQGGTATGGTNNTTGNPGIQGNATQNGGYGGNAPANGGLGGAGSTNINGGSGIAPGGGGGGGERGSRSRNGGSGGSGGIKITYAVPYLAQIISANTGSPTWCAGETRTVSVTIKNIGSLPWTDGGGNDFNIGIKWNTNGTSWNDYNVRVDAQNLAPGETKTYNFNITAQTNVGGVYGANLPTGNNNLTFDVVYEGKFWFGNNNGGGGPGNSVFTSPAINILAVPAITTNPTNASIAAGANTSFSVAASNSPNSYTWQVSTDAGVTWSTITNGGVYSNATTSTLNITGATYGMNGYRYRASATNGCGTSPNSNHATLTINICNGTTQSPNALYINRVSIVGTMADPPPNNNTGAGTNGYSNYTNLPQIAQQAQGEGVNVLASANGSSLQRGRWKAWIDWNGNGVFETGELVYTTGNVVSQTANFGFAISATQAPGNYRMRIRINNGRSDGSESYGYDFGPCDNFTGGVLNGNFGETEDYLIKVVANCSSRIATITNGSECNVAGGKAVILAATSNEPVTEFRWYDTQTGNSGFAVSYPDATGMATTFTTDQLSATKVYYVAAYRNGGCESTFRVPVFAEIKPTPEITFTPSALEVCGQSSVVAVSATGSSQIKHLIPKQTFETGGTPNSSALGTAFFSNEIVTTPAGNSNQTGNATNWLNRTSVWNQSTFSGTYLTWYPAISSGFGANKFLMSSSDIGQNAITNKALRSVSVDSRGLTNMTFKFRMFFSKYLTDNENSDSEYVAVEVSVNNGNWVMVDKIIQDVGYGTAFGEKSYNLNAYTGNQNLRVRIRYYANGWFDGVAVDDIELYGEEPLQPSFVFSHDNPIGVYKDAAGLVPYDNGAISTVYIKPTDTQIQSHASWNLTATANLTNSCNAVGTITITNNTKVWNPAADTLWHGGTSWLPVAGTPDADKCVIVKKPVVINAGIDALAKNIRIETTDGATGKLTINGNGSLTVTDEIVNTGPAANFLVSSDANLIQVNKDAVNIANIAVRRALTLSGVERKEYNFVSSPVEMIGTAAGFNMRYIYGNNPANIQFVTVLNEPSNTYVNASNVMYGDSNAKGRGYAVKEPKAVYTDLSNESLAADMMQFKGQPNNGDIDHIITRSASNRGWNLIGNPYPSNLDLKAFYDDAANGSTKIQGGEFRFWDNKVNHTYEQYGGNYNGYSFALYNAASNAGNPAPGGDAGNNTGTIGTSTSVGEEFRYAKVGQGFLIRALGDAPFPVTHTLTFKNTHRTTEHSSRAFFGRGEEDHRSLYRLQLITSDSLHLTQTVVYYEGGQYGYGLGDSRHPSSGASDAFYSFADSEKIIINGRPVFDQNDVLPLGTKHFAAGTYRIRAITKTGVFANGQSIYLKDKELGIITDLSESDYTFTSGSGEYTNRFEIVYQPETVLSTGGVTKTAIEVYRDGADFAVRSSKELREVELYDVSGKLVLKVSGNAKEIRFAADRLSDGIYVIKAQQKDGAVHTQKIRR